MMVFNTAGTQIGGDISTTNQCSSLNETMISTTSNITGVFADSGSNALEAWFFPEGGAWTQITDGDFPTTFVKGWAYLDGTTYVARPDAGIQGDALNDPQTWDPLNVIIAQIEPDKGVGLAKQLVYVVIFKQWSTEIYYDGVQNILAQPEFARNERVRGLLGVLEDRTRLASLLPARIDEDGVQVSIGSEHQLDGAKKPAALLHVETDVDVVLEALRSWHNEQPTDTHPGGFNLCPAGPCRDVAEVLSC